jgi:cell wall assembly regulator SMI1
MAARPVLSLTQLERLEALWAEQRVPLVEHLRRGLADKEIETQLQSLGLRLPSEAALWWGWHDGVPSGQPRDMGGSCFAFLPLGDAIREHQPSRRVAETAARTEEEADHLWHPSYTQDPVHLEQMALVSERHADRAEPAASALDVDQPHEPVELWG